MEYKWSILNVSADNGVITHAEYRVVLTDGDLSIATEGNWWFKNPIGNVAFQDVKEEMVAYWIEQESMKDGVNPIKSRLEEQLTAVKAHKPVDLPWCPPTFTPNI